MSNEYCIKCGSITKKLLHHHEKYLEIHGYDKVVLMCKSCHKKLHDKLRRENKCNIPSEKLCKISTIANNRRPEKIEYKKRYYENHREKYLKRYIQYNKNHQKELREYMKQYNKNRQEKTKDYNKQNMFYIKFYKKMIPSVYLYESISYNYKTGSVSISSYFNGTNKHKLFYIDIGN